MHLADAVPWSVLLLELFADKLDSSASASRAFAMYMRKPIVTMLQSYPYLLYPHNVEYSYHLASP